MWQAVQVLEYFMNKGAEVGSPRWWFLDVVESANLELLRAVAEGADGRRGEILRRREHPISIPLRSGVVRQQPELQPFCVAETRKALLAEGS
jgi:hypothetical protein